MKFNFLQKRNTSVKNYEGAKAYSITPEMELYATVATSLMSDSYYEKENTRLIRIKQLIPEVNPEFIAKLASYARNQMNLRSIPMVLTVELAKQTSGNALVSKTVQNVVQRPDEIMEMLAYYQIANERKGVKRLNKLSKQIQKGLAVAFNRFDEYQFAKYNRAGVVMLKDALFIIHPKAKNITQQLVFNKIANDSLATPYTWETELSAFGQISFDCEDEKRKALKLKWEELIESRKIGYMALLRNLRNILEAGVSGYHVTEICSFLSDASAVARSKQLPFRFLAAYREIKECNSVFSTSVLNALEKAVSLSVINIKGFDQKQRVLIACDVSGSMQNPVSRNSKIKLYDIGLMLGMLLQSKCKLVISGMFGDTWKVINMPGNNVLSNVEEFYLREGEVGYSTNGYKVLEDLLQRKIVLDKIFLFTDCQLWDSSGNNSNLEYSWNEYKLLAPDAKMYLFDLAGYGQMPIRQNDKDVCTIAGWSDKVFDVLLAIEESSTAVEQIFQLEL